jgi:uncharacterized membrane protein
MSDTSTGTISIEAPVARVQEILFDLASYPQWSTSIKSAEVQSSDGEGRVTSVKLSIEAGVMKDRVTLDYDWSNAPGRLEFSLSDADLLTAMDGAYVISEEDEESTQVTYELTVALSMPVPAMMRKKQEQMVIDLALKELKKSAES